MKGITGMNGVRDNIVREEAKMVWTFSKKDKNEQQKTNKNKKGNKNLKQKAMGCGKENGKR